MLVFLPQMPSGLAPPEAKPEAASTLSVPEPLGPWLSPPSLEPGGRPTWQLFSGEMGKIIHENHLVGG